jgi:hypothetical protein
MEIKSGSSEKVECAVVCRIHGHILPGYTMNVVKLYNERIHDDDDIY